MKYLPVLIALFLTGCIPMNKSEEQTESLKTAFDTQGEILESQPIVSGNNNKVLVMGGLEQVSRNISAQSKASMESTYSLTTQVSMGFNLIMIAVALLMFKSMAKGSKALKLTAGLLDNGVASAISMATNSTDPKDIAAANHFRAEMESLKRYL